MSHEKMRKRVSNNTSLEQALPVNICVSDKQIRDMQVGIAEAM